MEYLKLSYKHPKFKLEMIKKGHHADLLQLLQQHDKGCEGCK